MYKERDLTKLSFMILLTLKFCLGWKLPPPKFLSQFSEENDRTQISLSIPVGNDLAALNGYFKQLASINEDFEVPASILFIQNMQNKSTSKNPEDLIVFVPDEDEIDGHLKMFTGLFNQRNRASKEYWLLDISPLSSTEIAKSKLQTLKLDLDDDLLLYTHSNRGLELYEAYRIQDGHDITIRYYGFWSHENGLVSPTNGKWIRRKNMEGAKLKVLALVSKPYITDLIPTAPGELGIKGIYADIFFALQDILNFTFVVTKPPDEQWGAIQSDGTWTGFVRELQDERADVAVTDITITVARSNVITFAQPITEIYHSLFIKNPMGTFNFKAYVETLKYMSWLFVGLFCILAPTTLCITTRFGHEPEKHEFTWGKSQVFVLSSLTMRGWSVCPKTYSSKCVFIVIMLAGILIYYHWEAMLISYLSTRFTVLPFNGIRELVENSDYKIGLIPGTSYEDTFKLSLDPIFQRAYSERIEPYLEEYAPFYEDMNTMLLNGDSIAIYQHFGVGSYSPSYQTCEVIVIPAKYDFKHMSYGFQKDSPYLGLFNHYIKELREKGILNQISNKYDTGAQVCPDESGKPLGFESCFTAFLALLAGMAIGFILFFIETINKLGKFNMPIFDAYNRRDYNIQK